MSEKSWRVRYRSRSVRRAESIPSRTLTHAILQRIEAEDALLTGAKFKVGEMVDFNPARSVVPVSIQKYEVLKLLPRERGEQYYRIKSKAEAFARIAKESDLSARKD